MMAGWHRIRRIMVEYGSVSLLSFLVFAYVIRLSKLDLHIPINYQGDAVYIANWIKTILASGWYFSNPYLGAPGQCNLIDLPHTEAPIAILINLLGFATNEVGLILNIIYILSYPLVACTALFAFKRLSLAFPFAFVASLLYTLQPYHFMRSEGHLLLSFYYAVPLSIWFAFWLCEKPLQFYKQKPYKVEFYTQNYPWFIFLFMCLLLGSVVAYYSFYSAFFIIVLGSIVALDKRKLFPLKNAALAVTFISIAVLINIWPFIVSWIKYGEIAEIAKREFYWTEIFGLKIMAIIFPPAGHRLSFIQDLAHVYTAPNLSNPVTEMWQYMGIFGVIGFLTLLWLMFVPRKQENKLFYLSDLNVCGVLFSLVGGFGIIFSLLVSPTIRCHARIAIYLVFFSLFAFFYLLNQFVKRYPYFEQPKKLWLFLGCVLFLGIFDLTSPNFSIDHTTYPTHSAEFKSDKQFVEAIEAKLEPKDKIFQLPYNCFPECITPEKMIPYDHLKLPLYSHKLYWSYGASRNSAIDKLQCSLASKSTRDLINEIVTIGFSGITVNRDAYKDRALALEKELKAILKVEPMISPDRKYIFFELKSYQKKFAASPLAQKWQKIVDLEWKELSLKPKWKKGFYPVEVMGKDSVRMAKKKATLIIFNKEESAIRAKIQFKVASSYKEYANLIVRSAQFRDKFEINSQGTLYSKEILLLPGKNTIRFETDARKVETTLESRKIHFGLYNFELKPILES